MCPGGQGALTPCVSWAWRGLGKKRWAPLRIISGTALTHVVIAVVFKVCTTTDNKAALAYKT